MDKKTILVADDDAAIRTVLNHALMRAGFDVRVTSNVSTLWKWLSEGQGQAVVSDVIMPDGNAFDLLPRIRKIRPSLPVVLISAQNTLMTAIKAKEAGANEYLPKPFDLDELIRAVQRVLSSPSLTDPVALLDKQNSDQIPLVGRSSAMQEIYRLIARSMEVELPIMLFGESGTGKTLTAKTLHDYGKRKSGEFVQARLSAIPPEQIEDELFGNTDNDTTEKSLIERANQGTIYIENINALSASSQSRLMRLLVHGELLKVNAKTPINIDVRIICSSENNMETAINLGSFRRDLFHRLNVIPMHLPPLEKRLEDIADLARYFLSNPEHKENNRKHLDESAIGALKEHYWPGNIRELKNLMNRITIFYPQETIDKNIINLELGSANLSNNSDQKEHSTRFENIADATAYFVEQYFEKNTKTSKKVDLYNHFLNEFEPPVILAALKATNGNQIKAASILGLNRNTLRKKINEHDIKITKIVR